MAKYTNRVRNDQTISSSEDDVIPIKTKSKPDYHFCYVCREWFFLPIEDFFSSGHFTLERVEVLASKTAEHGRLYADCLKVATPKPLMVNG